MAEHIILVAFKVEADDWGNRPGREVALSHLQRRLDQAVQVICYRPTGAFDQPKVTAWWKVEDDRVEEL